MTKSKPKSQEEIQKESQEIANKCLAEVEQALKKYNCTIEVKFMQDTVMGEKILRFQALVMHHAK